MNGGRPNLGVDKDTETLYNRYPCRVSYVPSPLDIVCVSPGSGGLPYFILLLRFLSRS